MAQNFTFQELAKLGVEAPGGTSVECRTAAGDGFPVESLDPPMDCRLRRQSTGPSNLPTGNGHKWPPFGSTPAALRVESCFAPFHSPWISLRETHTQRKSSAIAI